MYKYLICLFIFLFFSCDVVESNLYGCMDSSACNYNPNANKEDDRCIYILNDCGVCGGDVSGTCNLLDKPQYTTKEACESAEGTWVPNCSN